MTFSSDRSLWRNVGSAGRFFPARLGTSGTSLAMNPVGRNRMATGKEHQARGIFEQVKGALKEGFGAFSGNRKLEAEGKAGRAKGVVRETYGEIKSDLNRTDDPTRNDPTRNL
jgi:uncharacterized protein YjbJ (UPF0337 family)